MSKSSSMGIKVFRWVLRVMALFLSVGAILYTASGGLLGLLWGNFGPSIVGCVFVLIGGNLIVHTLCPDKNDVANPNWKVAEAIRRAVKHSTGGRCMEMLGLIMMIYTGRHPLVGYTYAAGNITYFSGYTLRIWGWLHYIIYGSRKHLKKYATENASAYFGFSTIGLNKTLTKASSNFSSVISGRSLAVSSAPTD